LVILLSLEETRTSIHNIELISNRGGQIVRAAGTSAILAKEGNLCYFFKIPSKKFDTQKNVLLNWRSKYNDAF
jgi:ribosomal protein L2